MKTYFIRHGDFANIYDLAWADNKADISWLVSQNFERCTRREAERKARLEFDRRHFDHAFSGFASVVIVPANYYRLPEEERSTWLYRNYERKGWVME